MEPTTSGDPSSHLRRTSKSVRRLEEELRALGHDVSHRLVADLLGEEGYSLQANSGLPILSHITTRSGLRVRAEIDEG